MKILGISAYCSNASACIVIDSDIVAAAQEERFTRIKGDASFPSKAIDFCLNYSNLELKDLDAIAFHDKPLLRFERLLETHYAFAPKGLKSFLASMPVWINEKVFLRSLIFKELKKLRKSDPRKIKLLFSEHHLSHAASSFYTSPYDEAAILVIDSVGEWATTSICHGHQSKIKIIKELRYPHSLGLLYNSFATYLGYDHCESQKSFSMLASLGDYYAGETSDYVKMIKGKLVDIKQDGSIHLNQAYFQYTTGAHLINEQKWELLFGFPKRNSANELKQYHYNLALAFYTVLKEIIINLCREAKQLTQSGSICLSGDMALDTRLIAIIQESGIFDKVFIQSASGDDGAAIGAALAVQHLYFRQKRVVSSGINKVRNWSLGPSYPTNDLMKAIEAGDFQYYKYDDQQGLMDEIAELIKQDKIVGVFRGRMEFGAYTSGHRSILANPDNPDITRRVNTEIKGREALIPLELTTVDNCQENSFLHELLKMTKKKALVNCSMCSINEPTICSPEDAINFFKNTGMDYLVMDCYLISKELNIVKQKDIAMEDCITS